MEMSALLKSAWLLRIICMAVLLLSHAAVAQDRSYTIRDGRMYIAVDKKISDTSLDSFIVQFDLVDLGLKQLVRKNKSDSLLKAGWKIVMQNETGIVISKAMEAFGDFDNPVNKIMLTEKQDDLAARFPAVSSRTPFGANRFKSNTPFVQQDSIVRFLLRNHQKAERVYLAGSFNNWEGDAQAMKQTDSGWIAYVKLAPGKYWYKFVVDGRWQTDPDNQLRENDGEGNTNSVFFRTNTVFSLDGFTDARNVFLSGSFNGWKHKDLRMARTANGWQLPLYLSQGTHAYKFIVDGKWIQDPKVTAAIPDGAGGFNSVIAIGSQHLFSLEGFANAKKVMVAGSFNFWRDFELEMKRTATGWELPYTLGPGNYEYKFIVDGKWISDPGNPMTPHEGGNSFLIIEPNYTFHLKGFENARKVFVAGDFNGWNPEAYPMRKTAAGWIFPLNLQPGKVRYKFIVDGEWILDPDNKLWEQNEHRTGNSIIWVK